MMMEKAANKDYLIVAVMMLTMCFFGYLIQKEVLLQRLDYSVVFFFALGFGVITLIVGGYPLLKKRLTHHTTI
jgi:hypothetical protein